VGRPPNAFGVSPATDQKILDAVRAEIEEFTRVKLTKLPEEVSRYVSTPSLISILSHNIELILNDSWAQLGRLNPASSAALWTTLRVFSRSFLARLSAPHCFMS